MRRIMISDPNCINCRRKKVQYQDMGLPLEEINIDSEQGKMLIEKLDARAGSLVDLDEMRLLDE